MLMLLMIISPFGHSGGGRPLRGMRCIDINQITTAVAPFIEVKFKVKWYFLPVDQFLKVLRN
jgi:hypothetical protein